MSERLYVEKDVDELLSEYQGENLIDLPLWAYSDITTADFLGLESRSNPLPIGIEHDSRREDRRGLQQEQQQMQQHLDGYYIEKPYNIILNWRKLLSNIPENALIVGGALSASWMMIMAALVLTKKLLDLKAIKLTEDQATVMLVLSARYGMGRNAEEVALYDQIKNHLEACGMSPMGEPAYHQAIDDLIKLHSIEVQNGKVRLVESVPLELIEYVFVYRSQS